MNYDPSALRAQLPARFGNPEWEFTRTHVGADGVLAFSFHPKDPALLVGADIIFVSPSSTVMEVVPILDAFDRLAAMDEVGAPDAHQKNPSATTVQWLLDYLEGGSVVAVARSRATDEVTHQPDVVPLVVKTDGEWVWTAAMAYYLRVHAIPLDPQLEAHILNKPIGPARAATTDEVRAAAAALGG